MHLQSYLGWGHLMRLLRLPRRARLLQRRLRRPHRHGLHGAWGARGLSSDGRRQRTFSGQYQLFLSMSIMIWPNHFQSYPNR